MLSLSDQVFSNYISSRPFPPFCAYLFLIPHVLLKRKLYHNGYSGVPLCSEIVDIAYAYTEIMDGLV